MKTYLVGGAVRDQLLNLPVKDRDFLVVGATPEMLLAEGFPRHARVCERHTGAGITRDQILVRHLPLPMRDFLPETMEEKLICYADKFFSKTRLDHEKTLEEAEASLAKFGEEGIHRFRQWERMFR